MSWAGRTTLAQQISSIRPAPALRKALAQASAVLPLVKTSSTRMTVLPSIGATALNAPATAFRR
jgi:hypothetical protein